ncbi:FKBP-type peptidyl-prolyl cis-trans isomerase [Arsenicicoccus sp. oral taxon 190]|uniref:FKBP-type peptidyl-prolyl cis-trans isomerase n=1 Tax=Arsenicicoccus sp. oral taxon 190 TaxID=1658671 RepID=UPI00067AF362|nr:FKBP-type peptidyl-prolyl cis-trans isomerase [Arsenicicoccus sp. oral taxon 190]
MRLRTTTSLALLAAPAIALSACGGASTTTSTTSTASPSGSASASASPSASQASAPDPTPAAQGDVPGVTVAGTKDKPTVTVAKPPLTTKTTTAKVVSEGTGPVVKASDMVVANAIFVSGKTGKTLEDTFSRGTPQQIPVKGWLSGVAKGIVGQKAGSRVLVAIAPEDAFGAEGNQQAGIGPNESILTLVEIQKVGFKGEACKVVTSPDGLPQVTAPDGKAATMKPVTTPAPKQPTLYVLKQGDGPVVQVGQTLSSQYTGMLWTNGTKFDSSYDNGGQPVPFPIGVGRVIPAWDKCLTGQKVGSRVLVVAPPADAYGAQAQGKIPANSTLVFVVDLVKAQ